MYTYRAGVRKRRCGEAVWRFSATVSPAYRIGLRERRSGENVYIRPSSPLDSQMVGSCRKLLRVTFFVKCVLTPYRKYIISRTEDGQHLMSLGATTSIEPFSLREYVSMVGAMVQTFYELSLS